MLNLYVLFSSFSLQCFYKIKISIYGEDVSIRSPINWQSYDLLYNMYVAICQVHA